MITNIKGSVNYQSDKINIKNWKTGEIIFSYECKDNTIKKTVEEAIKEHKSLTYADLNHANLSGINLYDVVLFHVNLRGADLSNSNLDGINVLYTTLSDANLNYSSLNFSHFDCCYMRDINMRMVMSYYSTFNNCDLNSSTLDNSNFSNSEFYRTNLSKSSTIETIFLKCLFINVNLSYVNLKNGYITYASFSNILNMPNILMSIPEGEFIGWKVLSNNVIAKLKILEDSKRLITTSNKCRCDKALVLEFQDLKGNKIDASECHNNKSVYKINEIFYNKKWDENRWDEYGKGIYFFLSREEAVDNINF